MFHSCIDKPMIDGYYSEFGCIISSCRTLVNSFFTNSRIEFVRRQVNEVAHVLAGQTTLIASPAIYFHILESFIIMKCNKHISLKK